MATTSGPTEEIIEKKASAPVATACLIIACVALIGAIAFEVAEIAGYRSGGIDVASETPGQDKAKSYIKKLKADVEDLMTQNAPGAAASSGGSMDADTSKPAAPEESAEPEEPAATDEPAADEPAADEPADAEPAADEPAPDEEPAADAEPASDDAST